MWAAYQVCLGSGDYIMAPNDDDYYCIRAAPPAATAAAARAARSERQRVKKRSAQKPRHCGLVFTGTTHTLLFTRAPKGWAHLSLRSLSAFALVSSSLSTAWA